MECLEDENMLYFLGDSELLTGAQRMAPFPQAWERILESMSEHLLLAPGQGRIELVSCPLEERA